MDDRINDVSMDTSSPRTARRTRKRGGGSEFHRRDRARKKGETEERKDDGSVPRGCLQRLYADEEGRATMTRDDVSGPGASPRTEKKPIRAPRGRKGVSRRGARAGKEVALARASAPNVFSSSTSSLSLFFSLFLATTFRSQTRSCTTHPYINMSSSARSRGETEPIQLGEPVLPPSFSSYLIFYPARGRIARLAPSRNVPSSSHASSNAGCVDRVSSLPPSGLLSS